jgi:GntR family transcriptional regulator/MocR family aminotransferase
VAKVAFADFLRCGEFDRHLRRMRALYRRRRDALIATLRERIPDIDLAEVIARVRSA